MIDNETKARIREQSRTVATYMKTNEQFENWFYEIEGFGFRAERFYSDCEYGKQRMPPKLAQSSLRLGFRGRTRCS